MDKNWLIRTKSNHILGPISKEKVLELFKNGSIKPDDEVCTGNGYWFFIREDDMVQRFLLGHELQGFNPISEAKDILTNAAPATPTAAPTTEDITMVGGLNLALLRPPTEAMATVPPLPEESPKTPVTSPDKEIGPGDTKKKNNVNLKAKSSANRPSGPLKKQNYLKYIGILGFLTLFLLVYFRKSIIRSLFHGEITQMSFTLLDSAHAQENLPEKKKSF